MDNIKDRCVLVTGGTSGIGLETAKTLAAAGARVTVSGLGDADQIAGALDLIGAAGGQATPEHYPADLRVPHQIHAMMESIEKNAGPVEILFNNAGIQYTARTENFPHDKWDEMLAVNLSAAFHTSAAVLPGMRERNFGRIINTASVQGLVGSKDKSAYVASKHGLVGLTKVIALENADLNITCNAICPGFALTSLAQNQIDKIAETEGISNEGATEILLREKQPTMKFTKIEDIAAAVLFLLSPAGNNMTGSCLNLDGGWTAQ